MTPVDIDTSLFIFVNRNLQNSFFDVVMPFVTSNAKLFFLPLVIWSLFREKGSALKLIIAALAAVALADGSGHVLKDLIGRTRPCHVIENVNLLTGCTGSFSMPSGHASNAFAFAMIFWLLRRNVVTSFFVAFAAVVAFSRVYVGVHYPSDVIVGALLGMVSAYASISLGRWMTRIYRRGSHGEALTLMLLLFFLFRIYYIITGPFDLSADEAHYWEWSRRLDWSYYSKGPMIAYLIWVGTHLFGNTVFGVRIMAAVLGALSGILIFLLGRRLYDEKAGFVAALLVQVVPLYSIFGVLMTIDAPFIFFWILSLFLFWRAVTTGIKERTDRGREGLGRKEPDHAPGPRSQRAGRGEADISSLSYWILLGISVGFGLLTKYTMALFYLSSFLFLVFRKDERRFLRSKGPYAAVVVSAVLFSPVIAWNASHGWVTVRHTAGQAHIADGLAFSPGSFFEFLGSQVGVVTPILFVLILAALWKVRREREGAFLFWFAVPTLLFFALKSVQGKVQGNWALPAYATGFIAFAAYYVSGVKRPARSPGLLIAASVLLAFAVTLFAHFPGILRLPPRIDPAKKLVGWKGMGVEAGKAYDEIKAAGPAFIFSDSYGVSSELAFYVKGNPVVYCANLGNNRMNQYDLWPGFESLIGYNAIFVTTGDEKMPAPIEAAFERYERQVVSVDTGRGRIMKFTVFKCYHFRGMKTRPVETY